MPLVGVGFMYPQGYFRQRMTNDGWQEERYERISWTDAPIEAAITPDGKPCITAVPLGDRTVLAAVWRVRLGRVRLFLLDTDLAENAPWDRELSARLYGGDRETRIQQEIILGIGGVRALRALGITPTVWHLNEGHAAFVALQRIRELHRAGPARSTTRSTKCGDRRCSRRTRRCRPATTRSRSTWSRSTSPAPGARSASIASSFLALGEYDNGSGSQFNMTALALRTAAHINGVSALHGEVTRSMWRPMWPDTPADQMPVRSITNGVHVPTWMAGPVFELLDRHFGPGWLDHVDDPALWERLLDIPDAEIWAMRQRLRHDLFSFIRERMRSRWIARAGQPGAHRRRRQHARSRRRSRIGYARRFTAYKRPELIFHDADRLARILNAIDRPVQIVFAGKAHPADEPAKHHLQRVFKHALDPKFGGRLAFIDDYDMHVAHYLVHGCDVWLNNPRKPLEASGTSGMKASLNGVPHLSIGDGWWAEGFNGQQRLADREPAPTPTIRPRPTRPTPRRSIALLEERDRAGVLRSRRSAGCRAAGSRSCARRCARTCRASRRGAWSSSTSRRCTGPLRGEPLDQIRHSDQLIWISTRQSDCY